MYGHGKSDLKFLNGSAEIEVGSNKIDRKKCTHQRPIGQCRMMPAGHVGDKCGPYTGQTGKEAKSGYFTTG